MAFFDLPLDQLKTYRPERSEPDDFDAFWAGTLAQARSHPLGATFTPVDFGLQTIETWDVTFNGYAGQPVKGWLLMPRQRKEPLPCVVEYIGYGGGRGFPIDWLVWSSAGYAHFIMDTRGQGSSWRPGDTPDIPDGANPFHPGFMTQGILSPKTYYYRRVFTDGVRAVEAARSNPAIRSDRIALSGASQGGGITVAVSGLVPDVSASMPDVPFLCHYRRAATLVDSMPYGEIINYLRVHRDKDETVWRTLSYFDGVNFATRATASAFFSTGLMDQTCPPSTVFAAYNYWAGGHKDIRVWTYNLHSGGESFQVLEKMKFLKALWSK